MLARRRRFVGGVRFSCIRDDLRFRVPGKGLGL